MNDIEQEDITQKEKKSNKIKMDTSYIENIINFKRIGIELIDKVIDFLIQAKKMLKKC